VLQTKVAGQIKTQILCSTAFFLNHAVYFNNNYYYYSALGLVWAEPEPSQATGMALVRCILGKF